MDRQIELDWLRGLMLVLMTVTHLPTWFSSHVGQPFGFVSAAEGFVFLSAFLVGSVYAQKARKRGYAAMRRALWDRALKVYGAHVALLLFLFWLLVPVATHRGAHAITDLATFYINHPHAGLIAGLLLTYNPPLLDILPMYVVFLVLSPLVIDHASRRGWGVLLTVSAGLWLFAQIGGGRHVYDSVAALVGWPVPYSQTGAFSVLAWQMMWLIGLRAGVMQADAGAAGNARKPWPRPVIWAAATLVAFFFVWRHLVGQLPFGSDAALDVLFDKWHLGPMRLLNFAALAILVVAGRRVLVAWARNSTITTLGRASLTVFSVHLLVCLALLAVVGDAVQPDASLADTMLVAGTLVTLYAVARGMLEGGEALRTQVSARVAQ